MCTILEYEPYPSRDKTYPLLSPQVEIRKALQMRWVYYYRIVEISKCEYLSIDVECARVIKGQVETLLCLQRREEVPVRLVRTSN
jgi:hypothetical protein